MNINSIILLRSAERQIIIFLDLMNKIPDEDFKELSLMIRKREKHVKSIQDAISYGNLFMCGFFIKELLESLKHESLK